MYILVDCVIFDMHNQPVAAEQKYDWGGWRESLWSSRISVRSVRVQRSKNCFGCLSLWVTLSEWYITSNLLPGMSFILQCDSDYVRTCRLCKILIHQLNSAIEVDFDIVFTFSLTHTRTASAVYKISFHESWYINLLTVNISVLESKSYIVMHMILLCLSFISENLRK